MFKKNNASINFKNSSELQNLLIHTMKKDLEKLKNPNFNVAQENKFPEIENISLKTKPKLTAKEKTSPFLTQTDHKEEVELIRKPEIKMEAQVFSTNNSENALSKNKLIHEQKQPKKEGKKIGVMLLVLGFILIIIGVGGYYFWKTRLQSTIKTKKEIQKPVNSVPKEVSSVIDKIPPQKKQDIFATDKPNYLVIDQATIDQTGVKKIIQTYGEQVSQAAITLPVEFMVVDKQNNPISFQDFAQKLGLNFPTAIISQLGTDFSLYIYNDNNQIRLGLVVVIQKSELLKKLFLTEEKTLPQDLQSLFLTTQYTLKEKTSFNDSQYKDYSIRYDNVISPEILSVDYTITKNNLIIGTTKKTIRVIIDALQRKTINSETNK